jgi:hypothetical protein
MKPGGPTGLRRTTAYKGTPNDRHPRHPPRRRLARLARRRLARRRRRRRRAHRGRPRARSSRLHRGAPLARRRHHHRRRRRAGTGRTAPRGPPSAHLLATARRAAAFQAGRSPAAAYPRPRTQRAASAQEHPWAGRAGTASRLPVPGSRSPREEGRRRTAVARAAGAAGPPLRRTRGPARAARTESAFQCRTYNCPRKSAINLLRHHAARGLAWQGSSLTRPSRQGLSVAAPDRPRLLLERAR